jgi:hypothetical protein
MITITILDDSKSLEISTWSKLLIDVVTTTLVKYDLHTDTNKIKNAIWLINRRRFELFQRNLTSKLAINDIQYLIEKVGNVEKKIDESELDTVNHRYAQIVAAMLPALENIKEENWLYHHRFHTQFTEHVGISRSQLELNFNEQFDMLRDAIFEPYQIQMSMAEVDTSLLAMKKSYMNFKQEVKEILSESIKDNLQHEVISGRIILEISPGKFSREKTMISGGIQHDKGKLLSLKMKNYLDEFATTHAWFFKDFEVNQSITGL